MHGFHLENTLLHVGLQYMYGPQVITLTLFNQAAQFFFMLIIFCCYTIRLLGMGPLAGSKQGACWHYTQYNTQDKQTSISRCRKSGTETETI